MLWSSKFVSPIGEIALLGNEIHLLEISLKGPRGLSCKGKESASRFKKEISELKEYFYEGRKSFDLDFRIEASPFALKVYSSMQEISYGKTASYSDLAKAAGSKKAFRAVGTVCGNNLLPIIVPCHRVLAKSGLGGFSSGLKLKKFLLELETH
jgi:methylated-DNA-[protein]-cysteine S-methyltransferase|tara:strand:- start:186 stop:644 length:459 start_codon:yes stop_codon:yes gene_type:complete